MKRIGKWWRHHAETHRRESDERERLISLLAIRDAFMVIVPAVLAFVPLFLFFRGGDPLSPGSGLAALPLAMMLVAGCSSWPGGWCGEFCGLV